MSRSNFASLIARISLGRATQSVLIVAGGDYLYYACNPGITTDITGNATTRPALHVVSHGCESIYASELANYSWGLRRRQRRPYGPLGASSETNTYPTFSEANAGCTITQWL
jgi:hypothetical protein